MELLVGVGLHSLIHLSFLFVLSFLRSSAAAAAAPNPQKIKKRKDKQINSFHSPAASAVNINFSSFSSF